MTERLHSLLNVAVLFFVRPGYFLPYGHGVSPFGKVWDACAACDFAFPARDLRFSALRACYSAARRSLGRLRGVRQGGAGYGATPPSRPPLHPPEAPPKKRFQFSSSDEGNASPAAGASLTRSARSGDLPPRRVNAKKCFRFVQSPLQPNTSVIFAINGSAL